MRLNLCILRPTEVHNPSGKSIGSAVLAQLTAESAYTSQGAPLSTIVAPVYKGSGPHLTHDALHPRQPTTQTAPWSVQPFLRRWLHNVPKPYSGWTVSPSTLPLPMGESAWSYVIHSSSGHTSPELKRQLDRFNHFAGLTSVTDWQTDRLVSDIAVLVLKKDVKLQPTNQSTDRPTEHATRSVTGCMYVRSNNA